MDKLPPRPGLPTHSGTASESNEKNTVGSSGSRGIRNQGAKTNLHKPDSSNALVKTSLKDRLISKKPEVSDKKTGVAIKNLSKTMATFQHAINACAKPGYRVSKNEAVVNSIKALRGICRQLGNTGDAVHLKRKLNDLLGTQIGRGRINMTLSDFGRISKMVNTVADAPTLAGMEKKTAKLLTRAKELLTDTAYNYSPKEYTAPFIEENARKGAFIGDNGRFADDADPSTITWDKSPKRTSHTGPIVLGKDHRPLNPMGVTGVTGRGELGLWGPNHAADTIITRPGANGTTEVLMIQRKDTGELALPGGMLGEQKGDTLNAALEELAREALAQGALVVGGDGEEKNLNPEAIDDKVKELKKLKSFQGANVTFKGMVKDRRNTDNAWMETQAWSVHLGPEEAAGLRLQPGDDAGAALWVPVTEDNIKNLYASHSEIIRTAPAIQQALEASRAEVLPGQPFPEGVASDLDTVDDSMLMTDAETSPGKASIPTPPPPPPLPEGQVTDVPSAQPDSGASMDYEAEVEKLRQNPEASSDYFAVLEKVKQNLPAGGGLAESTITDIETATAQVQVDEPAPSEEPDLVKAKAREDFDAVLDELKQVLAAKGGAVENQNPDVVASPDQSTVDDPALRQMAELEKALRAQVKKDYNAVVEELKGKIQERGGPVDPDLPDPDERGGAINPGDQASQESDGPTAEPDN